MSGARFAGPAPTTWALGVLAFVLACALVAAARPYARHARVLDVPNARSSHRQPTPRGGGLGLVASLLVTGTGAATLLHAWSAPLAAALLAILAVATVGWIDDRRSLPVLPRLATHVAAGGAVAVLALSSPHATPWAGAVGSALWAAWWVVWAVSAINVVNFMDGIDGLIGSQVALFGAHVALHAPAGSPSRALAVVLAAASAGFLVWNWAPAKIFLGDVGSGAVGLAAVIVGLLLTQQARVGVVDAFLPLFPLFADAATTMFRRARRGERLSTPHRSHLYQRLANGGWGHARVSLLYLGAAAAGAAAALVSEPRVVGMVVRAAYFAACISLGVWLDRRIPLAPRNAAGA